MGLIYFIFLSLFSYCWNVLVWYRVDCWFANNKSFNEVICCMHCNRSLRCILIISSLLKHGFWWVFLSDSQDEWRIVVVGMFALDYNFDVTGVWQVTCESWTNHASYTNLHPRHAAADEGSSSNNNNNNNLDNYYGAFVRASHCESLSGSFDECGLSAEVATNPQTKPTDLDCASAGKGSYYPHPPSPFIIINHLKSWYSFYRPTEGGRMSRPRHCTKGVQPVTKAVIFFYYLAQR